MCYIFIFVLFENKKVTYAVNHEISSEYVDESMPCLLLLPLHSETVLSDFQWVSVCCNVKSNNTVYLDFWREDSFFENCHQDTCTSWMDLLELKTVENCNFKPCYEILQFFSTYTELQRFFQNVVNNCFPSCKTKFYCLYLYSIRSFNYKIWSC